MRAVVPESTPPRRELPAKIVYLAPADIQVARVDRQAIVYFCSALARSGQPVELVAMGIRLSAAERLHTVDPLELYGIQTRFPVDVVPTRIRQESPGWRVALVRLIVHTRAALGRSKPRPGAPPTVFYTKNYGPAVVLLALRRLRRIAVVFEVHVPPRSAVRRSILRRVDGVVANSESLAQELDVEPRRLLALHQGVDLYPYLKADRSNLRDRLQLPRQRKLAVYTGKLYYPYEEIEHIVRAASCSESARTLFVLVGGRDTT